MSEVATIDDVKTVAINANTRDVVSAISAFRNGEVTIISSIEATDFDSKLAVVDAITNSDSLDENLGKTILLTNFVVQQVQMVNEQTGTIEDLPRTILIDADGTAYHCISKGVFSGLENLVGVLGKPASWPRPVEVHAVKTRARIGQVMTLKLGAKASK